MNTQGWLVYDRKLQNINITLYYWLKTIAYIFSIVNISEKKRKAILKEVKEQLLNCNFICEYVFFFVPI